MSLVDLLLISNIGVGSPSTHSGSIGLSNGLGDSLGGRSSSGDGGGEGLNKVSMRSLEEVSG